MFVKMDLKKPRFISPGMGMGEFIAVGPCDYSVNGPSFYLLHCF